MLTCLTSKRVYNNKLTWRIVLSFGLPEDNKLSVFYSARVLLFTHELILSGGLASDVGLVWVVKGRFDDEGYTFFLVCLASSPVIDFSLQTKKRIVMWSINRVFP